MNTAKTPLSNAMASIRCVGSHAGAARCAAVAAMILLAACSPTKTVAGTPGQPGTSESAAPVFASGQTSEQVTCTTGWDAEWQRGVDAIVFLNPRVADNERSQVREVLESTDLVESFIYIDQDGAYAAFLERFEGSDQLRTAVRPEDVPTSFQLSLRDLDDRREAILVFLEQVEERPGVFEIADSLCHR